MTNTAAKALATGSHRALQYATCSDIGLKRTMNQDSFAQKIADESNFETEGHLFVVADGMGAHAAGELASQLAVDEIRKAEGPDGHADKLTKVFQRANAIIHEQGQSNPQLYNMGTTCSAIWFLPTGAIVGHVGDSRIYRCRAGRIEQLTFDHSLVWEMRAAGQVSGDGHATIPRNVITRCLGPHPRVEIDLEGPFSIQDGDVFLLCSDGLTGRIEDAELGVAMQYLEPEDAAEFLVDLANLRGGQDNITVTVLRTGPELQSAGPTVEAANAPSQDTHPAWWFLAGLGLALALVGAAVKSTLTIGIGGGFLLVACLAILFQWTRHRRNNAPRDTMPSAPYAMAAVEVNERFCNRIKDTFDHLPASVDTAPFLAEAEGLVSSTGDNDPKSTCARIRDLARRLRSL